MYKNGGGYVVECRRGQEYFDKAEDALEFAEFWAVLGYDSLIYEVQIRGDESWLQRVDEDCLRRSVALVI